MRCSTFDHDKVPDQDVRLQRARKNGQMKTTYLVEVVVCTPQAAQNDVVRAAGAAKMVFCVTNARRENGVLRDQCCRRRREKSLAAAGILVCATTSITFVCFSMARSEPVPCPPHAPCHRQPEQQPSTLEICRAAIAKNYFPFAPEHLINPGSSEV